MSNLHEFTEQEIVNAMVHDGWNHLYTFQEGLNLYLEQENLHTYSIEEALSLIIYGTEWDRYTSAQTMLRDYYSPTLWANTYTVQEWLNFIIDFLPKENIIADIKFGDAIIEQACMSLVGQDYGLVYDTVHPTWGIKDDIIIEFWFSHETLLDTDPKNILRINSDSQKGILIYVQLSSGDYRISVYSPLIGDMSFLLPEPDDEMHYVKVEFIRPVTPTENNIAYWTLDNGDRTLYENSTAGGAISDITADLYIGCNTPSLPYIFDRRLCGIKLSNTTMYRSNTGTYWKEDVIIPLVGFPYIFFVNDPLHTENSLQYHSPVRSNQLNENVYRDIFEYTQRSYNYKFKYLAPFHADEGTEDDSTKYFPYFTNNYGLSLPAGVSPDSGQTYFLYEIRDGLTDAYGSIVTELYPVVTDNEDGTWTVTDTFVQDNGFVGIPYNDLGSGLISYKREYPVDYFVDADPLDFGEDGEITFTPRNCDILGNTIETYLGGKAIPPYCIASLGEIESFDIFDRTNNLIWDEDNLVYDGFASDTPGEERLWGAETLMRGNEFLSSLNIGAWKLFVKLRESDGAVERVVAYSETSNTVAPDRAKILKAIKDTYSDAADYDFFIDKNSAMLSSGVVAETGDVVDTLHSISSDLEATGTATLQSNGSLLFNRTTDTIVFSKDFDFTKDINVDIDIYLDTPSTENGTKIGITSTTSRFYITISTATGTIELVAIGNLASYVSTSENLIGNRFVLGFRYTASTKTLKIYKDGVFITNAEATTTATRNGTYDFEFGAAARRINGYIYSVKLS